MTITLDELKKLLSMPGINSPYRPAITPAFITEAAFSVGDLAYSAVVTAQYIDKTTGQFEITFDVLGYTGPTPISLTINQDDIHAVRQQMGIGRDLPFTYNEMLTPRGRDDLATAIHALNAIAKMDDADPEDNRTWKTVALQCIDLATRAIVEIEEEAGHD